MDIRLDPQQVTYANVAALRLSDGIRIVAGIELSNRSKTEEGRIYHDPYRVLSMMYDDLRVPTVRQALPIIVRDVLNNVENDTKLVIFRSGLPHFIRRKELEEAVSIYARQRGIEVRFSHIPRLDATVRNIVMLAEDAIRRGSSLINAV